MMTMLKRVKNCALILGLATPFLFSGCPINLAAELREAAFAGAANAVQDATFDVVDGFLPDDLLGDDDAEE